MDTEILYFFAFRSLAKKNFGGKNAKILRKEYGKEIINYDIIKLLMLSSQSREFYKFFAQLIVAATNFAKTIFRIFRSIYYCEIRTNIFAFFRDSFRTLESLVSLLSGQNTREKNQIKVSDS